MRRHNKFCVLLTVVTFQRLLLKKSSALAEATTESAPMPSVEIACRNQRQVALASAKRAVQNAIVRFEATGSKLLRMATKQRKLRHLSRSRSSEHCCGWNFDSIRKWQARV